MIEKKYAVEQIKRFKILNFFPSDSVGLNELAMALMVSDTEQIAKQVVDDAMEQFVDCPKPAQIRIAAYACNDAVEEQRTNHKCPDCHGTRYISGTYLVTRHTDGERNWTTKQLLKTDEQRSAVRAHLRQSQDIVDAAEPCHCHGSAR